MPLKKTDLLNRAAPKVTQFDCPALGGAVCMRPISGRQRDLYLQISEDGKSTDGVQAWLICQSLCDENGKRFDFSEEEIATFNDVTEAHVLNELFAKALEVSCFTKAAVDEQEKN